MQKKRVLHSLRANRIVVSYCAIDLNDSLPAFGIAGFYIQPLPIAMIGAKETGASRNLMRNILCA